MDKKTNDILNAVMECTTLEESLETLMTQVAAQPDQATIQKILAQLAANKDRLAAAIKAGTPVEIIPPNATLGLTAISPVSFKAGDGDFTLTVDGMGFVSGSRVNLNGNNLATIFVSDKELTAVVPGDLTSIAQTVAITVVNPGVANASPSLPLVINS